MSVPGLLAENYVLDKPLKVVGEPSRYWRKISQPQKSCKPFTFIDADCVHVYSLIDVNKIPKCSCNQGEQAV